MGGKDFFFFLSDTHVLDIGVITRVFVTLLGWVRSSANFVLLAMIKVLVFGILKRESSCAALACQASAFVLVRLLRARTFSSAATTPRFISMTLALASERSNTIVIWVLSIPLRFLTKGADLFLPAMTRP